MLVGHLRGGSVALNRLTTHANHGSAKAQTNMLHNAHFMFKMSFLISLSQLSLSLALSNPTPLTHELFLHVPLASDPARKEMFCLILKCEVSCQVSLVTDLSWTRRRRGKNEKEKRALRKKMFVLHETAESQSRDQS